MALTFNMLENYFFLNLPEFCSLVPVVRSCCHFLPFPFRWCPIRRCPALTRLCCILSFLRFLSLDEIDIMLLSDRQTFTNTWSDAGTIFVAPNHQASLSYHVMRNPVLQSLKLLPRFPFIHQRCAAVWVFLICLSSNRCFYLRAILPHTPTPNQ